MSYAHNQRRKFIRRLKRHLRKTYKNSLDLQTRFKKIMTGFESEGKSIPDVIKSYASAIREMEGK